MDIDQDFTNQIRPRATPLLERAQIHNCVKECNLTAKKYLALEKVKETLQDLAELKLKPYEMADVESMQELDAKKFVVFRTEEIAHILGDELTKNTEMK